MTFHSPFAPVVLLAYKRPEHLKRTVSSLLRNPDAALTHLYVFCDAAEAPEDQREIDAVRRYVDSIDGFASVTRTYRNENKGLAKSMISGVTDVLRSHDRVIVLEDDLLLSPHFLRYMNDGLEVYAEADSVASIHGYCYPVEEPLPETFLLAGADCWGWATWSRAWKRFEPDGQRLLDELRHRRLTHEFDFDGCYPYTGMLEDQVAGKNDSWAIRWHASCYLAGLLTLYPGRSLVENIGNDATGTHSGNTTDFSQAPAQQPVHVDRLALTPSVAARKAFVNFFNARRGSPLLRAGRKLNALWHRGS